MIAGFFVALFSGHIYIIVLITGIQIISFKEVIAIANIPNKEKNLRFTKSLNWYFLATTMYFLYGESVIYYFKHILLVDKVLLPLANHHRFISFTLYVMGEYRDGSPFYPLLTLHNRIRVLCRISAKGTLSIPVHPVCLDSHGFVLDCCPSSLCHEQHL
jgi:CDP-diglyceride synthetase